MKIDKIHIENFGKLSKLTLNLNESLNEVYEVNGFGKTTLSVFIKAMFYGMPPARENLKMERKKYMPWQGGDFGGYIEYTTSQGHFRLTRFFGKTPESDTFELVDMTTNIVLNKPKFEIGEEIFEVGKDTFEMTAFFPQNNFLSFANNQISANILGLDKLKFDLANVNMAIDKIKKKESEIKKLRPSKEDIARKKSELSLLKNNLIKIQNEFENKQKEMEKTRILISDKTEHFEELEKQYLLQEELLATKDKIEKQLFSLSSKLNSLHLEQEKLNQSLQNLPKPKSQNSKSVKILTLTFGVILFLLPVLLGILGILPIVWAILISTIVVAGGIGIYFLSNNKKKMTTETVIENQIKAKQTELSNEITFVRNAINQLENNLKSYENITTNEDAYFDAKDEISMLKMEIERQSFSQQSCKRDIDKLIEEIDNIEDDINNLETKDKEIARKLLLLTQTKDFLSQANQNVSARFVEPVNNAMDEILQKFELGDRKFVVDTNFDIKQSTDKGMKEFDYFSQGIKDILSFCMRVYFIKDIYKKEKPFILLDDTFVNLDDENMKKASKILNTLSADYQIIYLYCHKRCVAK